MKAVSLEICSRGETPVEVLIIGSNKISTFSSARMPVAARDRRGYLSFHQDGAA